MNSVVAALKWVVDVPLHSLIFGWIVGVATGITMGLGKGKPRGKYAADPKGQTK